MASATDPQQGGAQPAAAAANADDGTAYAAQVQAGFALLRRLFAALDAGEEVDWEATRGLPGVVLDPMPWRQLCALIADGSERALGTLGRHPLGIKQYWDQRDGDILRRYASVTDFLMIDIFQLEAAVQQDGRTAAVVPPGFFWRPGGSAGEGGQQPPDGFALVTRWRANDFPYNLQPGIFHENLWANRPLSADEVEALIAQRVPPGQPRRWFVNTPSLQSVPALWHAHVLALQPRSQAAAAAAEAAAAGGAG